jgi:hypothetical protein|tara:strand:+ start:297 stop:554 length:258 start_codon:yes stop_codon:yes gene_type:complete
MMTRGASKKLSWNSPSPKSNAAYQKNFQNIFTNKKETKKAIKAAQDQARKIPDEYWIGGSFKKRIDLFWQKQKKERKKWKEKHDG